MPVKPQAMLYQCPKCGWKKIFAPESDCLTEMWPTICERCAHAPLDSKPLSASSILDRLLFRS